jgi:hypothetical protein
MFEKPQLIYESTIERRKHIRRFLLNILILVSAVGAWAAFLTARDRGAADPLLMQVGEIIALGLAAMMLVRAIFNLIRVFRTRNEILRVFDKGFTWQIGQEQYKYAWGQTTSFREGARQLRLGPLVLAQMGAHELKMKDGRTFRVTAAHGDTRQFARLVRPYIADVTGARIGRTLRNQKTVRLHPQLVVAPQGLVAGQHKIPWSKANIRVKRGRLFIERLEKERFKTVRSYPTYQVENLGGFVDVARSTIQNHQPKRFNIKTQGPSSSYA